MPSTPSLLPRVTADFPDITFAAGELFSWSPSQQTVFYSTEDPENVALLLHELSHGLLDHRRYSKDVELLAMETAAWDKARELAQKYEVQIEDDAIEAHLDTYRDWLHARSTCPNCEASGYQSGKNTYDCVACGHQWRVNEARLCGLKRYSISN